MTVTNVCSTYQVDCNETWQQDLACFTVGVDRMLGRYTGRTTGWSIDLSEGRLVVVYATPQAVPVSKVVGNAVL